VEDYFGFCCGRCITRYYLGDMWGGKCSSPDLGDFPTYYGDGHGMDYCWGQIGIEGDGHGSCDRDIHLSQVLYLRWR
jgi:hypothetical protein